DLHPAIHGVEDALGTALGSDPDPEASEIGQGLSHLLVHPLGPGDALEGDTYPPLLHLPCELESPALVDGEDIVHEPQLLGRVPLLDEFDLRDHVFHRASTMRLTIDRPRTPATGVGA